MSLLWAVAPVAVMAAVAVALVQLREMTAAAEGLRDQLRRFDEVRVAVAAVRTESAETRASLERLRAR